MKKKYLTPFITCIPFDENLSLIVTSGEGQVIPGQFENGDEVKSRESFQFYEKSTFDNLYNSEL